MIIRIDYPNQKAIDMPELGTYDEIDVTGSIVFVAGQSAFANYLWDSEEATNTGRSLFVYIWVLIQDLVGHHK